MPLLLVAVRSQTTRLSQSTECSTLLHARLDGRLIHEGGEVLAGVWLKGQVRIVLLRVQVG